METSQRDPLGTFNFELFIDNQSIGAFREVSGLTADGDAVDYRETTDLRSNVRKLPGLQKYPTITLKRGYTTNRKLWDRYMSILNGGADRRTVTIVLMNEQHQPVRRWDAGKAWIKKIEGADLKAGGNEVVIESLEIVHEGLTMEST